MNSQASIEFENRIRNCSGTFATMEDLREHLEVEHLTDNYLTFTFHILNPTFLPELTRLIKEENAKYARQRAWHQIKDEINHLHYDEDHCYFCGQRNPDITSFTNAQNYCETCSA